MTAPARLSAALADRYRLERELGQGGMATVYLAEDLKHDRQVAIKVLRPDLGAALGGERFLSEIRTTARLQHPHILPLLDSGDADGLLYYVMPFVSGETLRARLERERVLPIADAVRLATEVASALDYAHRQGVIHRDIKPENILLHEGQALVADFGIALAVQQAGGARLTQTGLSLGTPHYMSPEQAMGEKHLDARADVYALGAVLYEMLAGDPPFTGSSVQAIVARVLSEKVPPIRTVRDTVPHHVEAAVLTALAKLPADRFETANAFQEALQNPGFGATTATTAIAATGRPNSGASRRAVAVLAVACAALAALSAWGWLQRDAPERPVSRFTVKLWDADPDVVEASSDGTRWHRAAIAPDGSSLVFRAGAGDTARLYRKLRNERVATPMAGTEGAMSPFFSPDGAWVGFMTPTGDLRKVPAAGGGSVPLGGTVKVGNAGLSAAWMDDGRIVFVDKNNALRQVDENGGADSVLRPLDLAFSWHLWPLPGSKGVLINGCRAPCTKAVPVYVHEFGRDTLRQIIDHARGVWYAPSGHLVYVGSGGGLFAIAFDADRLETTGIALPVIEGIQPWGFTVAASGDALYATAALDLFELVWVARSGTVEAIDPDWKGLFEFPTLAPDGSALAVALSEGEGAASNIWVRRFDGRRQKLTFGARISWRPSWIDGGAAVMYAVRDVGDTSGASDDLWRRRADGSAEPELLLDVSESIWEGEMSRDGQWLVYRLNDRAVDGNVYARRTSGDTTTLTVRKSPATEWQVALSPDGRWMAYASNESRNFEIYVVSFPVPTSRQLVSRSGGTAPRWRADGKELFFLGGTHMMAVPVTPGANLVLGEPTPLFPLAGFRQHPGRADYDVAADGQRFLMLRLPKSATQSDLVYVHNFATELREKMRP